MRMKFWDMPYERIDVEKEKEVVKKLIEDFQNAKSADEQLAVHKQYYEVMKRVRTQRTLANTRFTLDTSDEFYSAENDYYDKEMPAYDTLLLSYKKLLLNSPYREEFEKLIGKPAFRNMELGEISMSEEIIPLKQAENALVSKYNKLIASAKIEWDGKINNLSGMTPYLTAVDRETRKGAAAKVDAFFQGIESELDDIYDELVKNRTAQAKALGYETYTELGYNRMRRNSYRRAEVERFRDQIKKDWVPFAEEIWKKRQERLGLDKMYFYDEGVSFKNGTPRPIGSYEDTLKAGQKMYRELSDITGEFYDFMLENDLLQVFPGAHKRAGGYMTMIPDYKAPFIFANFNGTAGDVDVVTHECGHAFQGYLMRDEEINERKENTMETAEIHSMSMEFFTNPWMELFFGERADEFLLYQIEDSVVFIPYGCMVDEFQHIVYDHPEMTPAERKAAWKELEGIYKPHMDYSELAPFYQSGGYWQRQAHIYGSPFYYIDYAIAQTCAIQYRVWLEDDYKKAFESYLNFSKASTVDFFENTIEKNGLMSPFKDGVIPEIAKKIKAIYEK